MNYMVTQQLVVKHPTDMIEITHRAKDFLKYIAHWSHTADMRRG